MIKYCKRCVMLETKPDLYIDNEGVCSACRYIENRKSIDWEKRREELLSICDRYRSKDRSNYDCIIPVSGGKDSHFQIKMSDSTTMIKILPPKKATKEWI